MTSKFMEELATRGHHKARVWDKASVCGCTGSLEQLMEALKTGGEKKAGFTELPDIGWFKHILFMTEHDKGFGRANLTDIDDVNFRQH